jgi:signal peptidase II
VTPARVGPALVRRRFEWPLIALVVIADQLSKLFVVLELGLHESVPVLRGVLDLTHVRNTGAAFGFLNAAEFPGKPIVIAVVALGALVGVSLYASQLPPAHWLARLGLALILGGAAGNLIDRLRQGYVVDFVDVYWGDWHFWAFNVADAAISVGVGIIIVDLLRPAHAALPPDTAHESESSSAT